MGALNIDSSTSKLFEESSSTGRDSLSDVSLAQHEISRGLSGFAVTLDEAPKSPAYPAIAKLLKDFCETNSSQTALRIDQALERLDSKMVGLATKVGSLALKKQSSKSCPPVDAASGQLAQTSIVAEPVKVLFRGSIPSSSKVIGIKNPKFDCFLIALFQVLILGIPGIQDELSLRPEIKNEIDEYLAGKPASMKPLRSILEERRLKNTKTWLDGQHDPQEALMLLMSALPKESPLNHHLLVERIYKKVDGYVRPVSPPNSSLNWGTLPIPFWTDNLGRIVPTKDGRIFFVDLLQRFMKREADPSENYRFELVSEDGTLKVLKEVPLDREITQYDRPLNDLILPINRFTFDGKILMQNEKKEWVNIPVTMPEQLRMSEECFANREAAEYDLSGFIVHEGIRADSGHYVSCVTRQDEQGNKQYFYCNDQRVIPITRESFLTYAQSAYILHFRRIA